MHKTPGETTSALMEHGTAKAPLLPITARQPQGDAFDGSHSKCQRQLKLQVAVCCAVMFAEGFYATNIFPYISSMTEELRGSKQSLGTFTGLLYTCQACGMLFSAYVWAKASNRFGRRRCLLTGLGCNVATTLLVAFSTDYWAIAAFRLLSGLLNNNLSIVRTSMRESFMLAAADDTAAFSMLSVAFGASSIAGPSLGGLLYGRLPTEGGWLQSWSPPVLLCTALYTGALIVVATCLQETAEPQAGWASPQKPRCTGGAATPPLLRSRRFLLLLAMGGGHSYVFTGWELVYPLLARLQPCMGGEAWSTSEVGLTFLMGSLGLMCYSLLLYPRLAKRIPVLRLWVWQWALPLLVLPAFPRALGCLISAGVPSRSLAVQLLNYCTQLVLSVLLGSEFISIQLLLNGYVAGEPDAKGTLALANSYLVSVQALVRALSPMFTGALFSVGVHGGWPGSGVALPLDHLALVGLVCGVLCALGFGRPAA